MLVRLRGLPGSLLGAVTLPFLSGGSSTLEGMAGPLQDSQAAQSFRPRVYEDSGNGSLR